jgi:hypothetical protein
VRHARHTYVSIRWKRLTGVGMIPALRLVPPEHTLVTLGERFFGGLTLYYDRAPRGALNNPH